MTDDDEVRLTQARMIEAMKGTAIEQWPVPFKLVDQLGAAANRLQDGHEFRGVFVSEPEPIFLFKARDSIRSEDIVSLRPKVIPYGWPGSFGSCFTLTCHFSQTATTRVTLSVDDDEAFNALSSGPVKWLFLRGHRPVAGLQLDFTSSSVTRENLAAHIRATELLPAEAGRLEENVSYGLKSFAHDLVIQNLSPLSSDSAPYFMS